ncbi:MAG: hypothetical protein CM1200mP2_06090 [Planctomycetaceae bacterium]|nr:MAG: hypothetical protein CM1200mP2_06090 [Planctomycetaceae bacterium]
MVIAWGDFGFVPSTGLTIAVIVVPVSVACGQLFVAANRLWRGLLETLPGLPDVPAIQEVNVLATMAEGLSLPGMVFVLAVLPAFGGKELVFRGVIGRGLVARGGVVHGIFLTSLLFAMAHINPAHAMSVFPLGVLLHVVHLATRSILAPILLHFLINGWAAVLYQGHPVDAEPGDRPGVAGRRGGVAVVRVGARVTGVLLCGRVLLEIPDRIPGSGRRPDLFPESTG